MGGRPPSSHVSNCVVRVHGRELTLHSQNMQMLDKNANYTNYYQFREKNNLTLRETVDESFFLLERGYLHP